MKKPDAERTAIAAFAQRRPAESGQVNMPRQIRGIFNYWPESAPGKLWVTAGVQGERRVYFWFASRVRRERACAQIQNWSVLEVVTTLRFRLDIDRHELMRYYNGSASRVRARAEDGRVVDFAARHLRRVLDQRGVHGRFEITSDGEGQFVSLRRLGD